MSQKGKNVISHDSLSMSHWKSIEWIFKNSKNFSEYVFSVSNLCGEQTCSSTCINNSLCKNCSGRLRMRTASLNNVALGGGNVRQRVLFSPLTSKGQSTPLASVKAQIQKFDRKRKSSCPGRFRGMEVKWTFQMSEIPEMWTVHRMNRSLSAPDSGSPILRTVHYPPFWLSTH